ncbi:hypothetical protein [Fodinicola acaciae]|uniref:hypothetical protein n=1 Tax=Fodinicola acaciae TaxID=2681555 RepID=UPI0013D6EE94|nr:hypothetical protein [Fodinicola acaciae]
MAAVPHDACSEPPGKPGGWQIESGGDLAPPPPSAKRPVAPGDPCGFDPTGNFESAVLVNHARQVEVAGWAIDPDTTGPVALRITVGAKVYRVTASVKRPDVAREFPAYGSAHGFHALLDVPADGAAHVWATVLNLGPGHDNRLSTRSLS